MGMSYKKPLVLAIFVRLLSLSYFLLLHPFLHSPSSVFDTSSSAGLSAAGTVSARLDERIDPFVRWDGLYFTQIALRGYKYEQEMAFLPGWLLVMRWSGMGIAKLRTAFAWNAQTSTGIQLTDVVLGGTLVANTISIINVIAFQKLTRLVTKNERFAHLCAILYAVHPAPAISSVAYTEPFYALCTFLGSILLLSSPNVSAFVPHITVDTRTKVMDFNKVSTWTKWIVSRVFGIAILMMASGTRSLGLLNCFVVVWPALLRIYRAGFRGKMITSIMLLQSAVECIFVISPFAAFQYYAYQAFCVSPGDALPARPWCEQRFPLVYSYVQDYYWNVGFMRYWTPAQIPNFLMASPILLASVYGGFRFIDTQYRLVFPSTFQRSTSKARLGDNSRSSLGDIDRTLWRNPDVIPFFLIHIITITILLFASHTQIALRVSIGNPVLFWVVAALLAEGEKTRLGRWARYGIVWTCVWGALSLVLWAGFYPPA